MYPFSFPLIPLSCNFVPTTILQSSIIKVEHDTYTYYIWKRYVFPLFWMAREFEFLYAVDCVFSTWYLKKICYTLCYKFTIIVFCCICAKLTGNLADFTDFLKKKKEKEEEVVLVHDICYQWQNFAIIRLDMIFFPV